MKSEFINFYLNDKKEELEKKWKIISFLEEKLEENITTDNEPLFKKQIKSDNNYYSISKLKSVLTKKKNVT